MPKCSHRSSKASRVMTKTVQTMTAPAVSETSTETSQRDPTSMRAIATSRSMRQNISCSRVNLAMRFGITKSARPKLTVVVTRLSPFASVCRNA